MQTPITDTPAMQEAIARTVRGVVPFASIVKGMRYTKKHFHPSRGTWWERDAQRECFMSVDRVTALGPVHGSFRGSEALQAELVDPKDLIWASGEHIGSLAVIPWAHVGLCLVIRRAPPRWIGTEWLAFVPLHEVAEALQAITVKAAA